MVKSDCHPIWKTTPRPQEMQSAPGEARLNYCFLRDRAGQASQDASQVRESLLEGEIDRGDIAACFVIRMNSGIRRHLIALGVNNEDGPIA